MKNESVDKEKRAGSPIFILIMFVIIIGFVFFIPEVYQRFNTQLADILGIGSKNKPNTVENNNVDTSNVSEYYQLGSNSMITFNDITISNISLEDNILSLTISSENIVDLDSLNYYLDFYKERKTFLGRRILTGTITGSKNFEIDVSNLDVTTTTYMQVSHIDDSVIESINLHTDESGLGEFTCTNDDTSYTYLFYYGGLVKFTKKYTYSNENLNVYSTELTKYKKLEKQYNELSGVTSSIAESSNTFIYTLELDYETIENYKIDEDYKYNKGAKDNIIKFKMEARGYSCEWTLP